MGTQRVQACVELLIVADYTIYQDHARLTHSDDHDVIFQSMRIYFAHLVNGVT